MSNALVQSRYRLSEVEHRLINAVVSQINPNQLGMGTSITETDLFTITVEDWIKLNPNSTNAARDMKAAVERLWNREITIKYAHEGTKHIEVLRTRWISSIRYIDPESSITIRFTPDILPYLQNFILDSDGKEGLFTQYYLSEICSLNGSWAPRIYQLLMQFKKTGVVTRSHGDLRDELGLTEKEYPRMSNFTTKLITPAIKEINKKIKHLKVKYKSITKGRKVIGHTFTFTKYVTPEVKKAEEQLPLDIDHDTQRPVKPKKSKKVDVHGMDW